MDVLDLRSGAPPRWNAAVDGIVWLPRLAAKVRAYDAGMLGTYLLGQSPVDDEFLRVAQLSYAEVIAIVRAAPDDATVLAGMCARSPGALERLRAWSLEVQARRRAFMAVLDFDDGYVRPRWADAPVRVFNALVAPAIGLARIIRPLRA
jgi:hypothetical protein